MSYEINVIIDDNANKAVTETLLKNQFANTSLVAELDDGYLLSGICVSDDKKTFKAVDLPDPEQEVTNHISTVKMYEVNGATIFVESGENDALGIWPAGASMYDYFTAWDFGDTDPATGLAEFGLDPNLDDAKAGDTNVRIWQTLSYCADMINAPHDDFVRDAEGDIMVFTTYAEAERWIADDKKGAYYLQHGEMDPADHKIVR
ncbi:hypothetical protein [Salinivibrio costicola]|jgi:hypothetical protein|uniref:hypothetical protein n=1 Tax=Salinivibrio costicola TaxID=51367 RepID=UPI003F713B0E